MCVLLLDMQSDRAKGLQIDQDDSWSQQETGGHWGESTQGQHGCRVWWPVHGNWPVMNDCLSVELHITAIACVYTYMLFADIYINYNNMYSFWHSERTWNFSLYTLLYNMVIPIIVIIITEVHDKLFYLWMTGNCTNCSILNYSMHAW